MIQAAELRIGNYFKWSKLASMGKGIDKITLENIGYYRFFEPIHLTDEILVKNAGFKELNDKCFFKDNILLACFTTDDSFQAEYKFSGSKSVWELIDVKYLHDIQNLYRSLRKKELKIKF